MKPILESMAHFLAGRDPALLDRTTVVLPNRRSGLFLQQHLARASGNISWSPVIQTISEFIGEMSDLEPADPVELPFMLYDLYCREAGQPEPLDEFYPWGELMVADFDELDKYLVDASLLFRNLLDLKEIEEPLAGLDEDQIRFIRQFWEGLGEGGTSREKGKFLGMWRMLPVLYQGIREQLRTRGQGYQGMLVRDLTEGIARGEMAPPDREIVVAGFNALNTCEKRIFSWLKQHGALFFWDYDRSYISDPHSEAGRFMRENVSMFPPPVALDSFDHSGERKVIRIFELPTDVLQAKTLYRILEEQAPHSAGGYTDTAVVLCDEELLIPVLTSLPGKVEEINITMGYPMRSTPVYSFVDALLRLHHNIRTGPDGSIRFYHRDVINVLFHPYLRNGDEPVTGDRAGQISRENLVYVDGDLFAGQLEKAIFRNIGGSGELFGYLRVIFRQILDRMTGEDPPVQEQLDRELILRLMVHLNKLEAVLAGRGEIPLIMAEKLLRKSLATVRIPFEGEPLAGIQIMGILESRMLDFDHVVFLSMNEEVMPAAHYGTSYIPYSLRRAFRLPAREEKDAIYAYYFNRLLQRAGKVDLLYNSGSEGVRSGEMSRYLHQLIYSRKVDLVHPGMDIRAVAIPSLEISRSPGMEERLTRFVEGSEGRKYLSPSAINTYLDCSMKFYLRYIAGIGEPDEVKEEIDAAGFGTVVHETIRILYDTIKERNGGTITGEDLENLLRSPHPEKVLRSTFLLHHYKGKRTASIEGRNIIALRIMLRYLEKIVRNDLAITPFELVSTESTHVRTLSLRLGENPAEVRLGGKIDRIDRVNGRIRVIDYKTGEAQVGFPSVDSLFDGSLSRRNGAALQTLFYAWLVRGTYREEGIIPGLYAMRSLYDPAFDPVLSMGARGDRAPVGSFASIEGEFLGLLKETVDRIYDPARSFQRTEHRYKCRICPFARICSRDMEEWA